MEILLLDDVRQWTQVRLLSLCLVFDRLVSQFAVDDFVQNIWVLKHFALVPGGFGHLDYYGCVKES